MFVILRPARPEDCAALTALATRSKAHWGYDATFMANCRDELAVRPDHIGGDMCVADASDQLAGFARLGHLTDGAELDAMYVDPGFLGQGVGRLLFDWCVARARTLGYNRMQIDADPHAEAFYLHMGAQRTGVSPSGSIPGRMLPQLHYTL